MSRSNREQAHSVLLSRRLAGKSGASQEGRTWRPHAGQLKVPCSTTIGVEEGIDIDAPPSPHEPQAGAHAGAHAGSCIGAPQAGWQGCGWLPPPEQGERNSIKEGGRRQLLALPKQLLQPGAAARLPRAITRHKVRYMVGISTTTTRPATACGWTSMRRPRRRLQNLAHNPAPGGSRNGI